ncbi:hypothetical protein P7K49_039824 [Saguinus oedipus]|uniref:Uncharacterized protein n=1 Tax=Saguinus oedipus TaxID=9490 RepID=A0ABQ9TCC8_SAGOE|nr:hypothetical protein P7K49_039824 [Saguinus oedipus]
MAHARLARRLNVNLQRADLDLELVILQIRGTQTTPAGRCLASVCSAPSSEKGNSKANRATSLPAGVLE